MIWYIIVLFAVGFLCAQDGYGRGYEKGTDFGRMTGWESGYIAGFEDGSTNLNDDSLNRASFPCHL